MSTVAPRTEVDDLAADRRVPATAANELADRRKDIDEKQTWVAGLLADTGCEELLVLSRRTSPGDQRRTARGVLDPAELPAVYFSPIARIISANVDSSRLFDEELNGLGFQLKEWSWYAGRERLLAISAMAASSHPIPADHLQDLLGEQMRQAASPALTVRAGMPAGPGRLVSHALEATCRTLSQGETGGSGEARSAIGSCIVGQRRSTSRSPPTALARIARRDSLPCRSNRAVRSWPAARRLSVRGQPHSEFRQAAGRSAKEHGVATRVRHLHGQHLARRHRFGSSEPGTPHLPGQHGGRVEAGARRDSKSRARSCIEQSFRPGRRNRIIASRRLGDRLDSAAGAAMAGHICGSGSRARR